VCIISFQGSSPGTHCPGGSCLALWPFKTPVPGAGVFNHWPDEVVCVSQAVFKIFSDHGSLLGRQQRETISGTVIDILMQTNPVSEYDFRKCGPDSLDQFQGLLCWLSVSHFLFSVRRLVKFRQRFFKIRQHAKFLRPMPHVVPIEFALHEENVLNIDRVTGSS